MRVNLILSNILVDNEDYIVLGENMVDNLKLSSINIGRIIVNNESNNEHNIDWTNILEAFDFECLLEENIGEIVIMNLVL